MRSAGHIVRGFTATLAARAVYMLSSALLMYLLAGYFLDPDEYGLLFWTIGILAVVQLGADLGFGKSAARYVAEYGETDPRQIPHVIRYVIGYKLVAVSVVAGLLLIGARPLAAALGEPAAAPFLTAGVLLVVAKSFGVFPEVVFQGSNRLVYSAGVRAVGGASRLVFAVVFVVAGFGALGAFFGYVVGYAIAAVVGLTAVYLSVYSAYEPATEMDDGLSRRLLEYSVPLTATRGANVLDKQIDIVLVGVFLNSTAVAFYTLAKQITDFVLAPAESLGFVISPNFGEGKAGGDVDGARALYETALSNALALYVPAAVGLVIVAEPFVVLVFGAEYATAATLLQLLSVFVVLQTITNLTSDGLDYLGRARERAIAKGVTSVGNFGLNLLLIPAFGVVGAAVATVVTHAVYVSVTLYVVHDELSLRYRSLAVEAGRVLSITGVMAATVVVVTPPITTIPLLVFAVTIGVLAWALLAVASGVIELGTIRTTLG
ncbi:oligosaccharide flippase family protein [Halovivax cerinus]|uniref:Oligosaccharide flippase family protein n=1 Tax=Halovivax cerinus TaxID=1487865 RepID=A0ABD5NS99_9EURY|nr:oligosaccharide flippase family protein [Halovivax cerinus]